MLGASERAWRRRRSPTSCSSRSRRRATSPRLSSSPRYLLHQCHGFDVTEHNRRRLLRALAGAPGFRFAAVPDGLPASDEDAAQDMAALHMSLSTVVPHLKKLVLSQLLLSPTGHGELLHHL
uniref:Uncharacterized protein n=1 Tax=Zea mays TaxID=4577 RepID=A0A804PK17_MAIZE